MRSALVIAVAFLVRATAIAQVSDAGEPEIALESVGGSVFVSTGTFTHAALSIGDDGVLLVDGVFSDVVEENGRILKRLTDRPLKFVVNTH